MFLKRSFVRFYSIIQDGALPSLFVTTFDQSFFNTVLAGTFLLNACFVLFSFFFLLEVDEVAFSNLLPPLLTDLVLVGDFSLLLYWLTANSLRPSLSSLSYTWSIDSTDNTKQAFRWSAMGFKELSSSLLNYFAARVFRFFAEAIYLLVSSATLQTIFSCSLASAFVKRVFLQFRLMV